MLMRAAEHHDYAPKGSMKALLRLCLGYLEAPLGPYTLVHEALSCQCIKPVLLVYEALSYKAASACCMHEPTHRIWGDAYVKIYVCI